MKAHAAVRRDPSAARVFAPARPSAALARAIGAARPRPKLRIGAPSDPAEAEADRIAERVLRMPQPAATRESIGPWTGKAHEGKARRSLSSLPVGRPGPSTGEAAASPAVARALAAIGPGRPLPDAERAYFEPRFGTHLDGVRIHDGAVADAAARSISARAFTLGNDIAFARGARSTGPSGRRLMAHELAHVVQQRRNGRRLQRQLDCSRVGGRQPSSDEARILGIDFPLLRRGDYCITAESSETYNCHACAVGMTDRVIDETNIGDRRAPLTYDELGSFFTTHGFFPASLSAVGADIVVFGSGPEPRHSACKTFVFYNGEYLYRSKLGDCEEIVHLLGQLEGREYGRIARRYARRPLRIEAVPHAMVPSRLTSATYEEESEPVIRRTEEPQPECMPAAPEASEDDVAFLEQVLCERATSGTGPARCQFRPWQLRQVRIARRVAHGLAARAALSLDARDPHILRMARRIFDIEQLDVSSMVQTLGQIRDRVFSAPILGGTCADNVCNRPRDRSSPAAHAEDPPNIVLCPMFFTLGLAPMRRTLLHEAGHLVGIDAPPDDAEYTHPPYCTEDEGVVCGDPCRGVQDRLGNVDAWARFIECAGFS